MLAFAVALAAAIVVAARLVVRAGGGTACCVAATAPARRRRRAAAPSAPPPTSCWSPALALGADGGDALGARAPARLPPPSPGRSQAVLFRAVDPARADAWTAGSTRQPPTARPPGGAERAGLRARLLRGRARALCLSRARSGVDSAPSILDAALRRATRDPLTGLPSRARVSPDGRFGAMTMFVSGDSYRRPGQFSTRTTLIDLASGEQIGRPRGVHGDARTASASTRRTSTSGASRSRATATTSTRRWPPAARLPRPGQRPRAHREVIHDERRVPVALARRHAHRLQAPRRQAAALAPARARPRHAGARRRSSERRPIDDQVEWLDNRTLLYGIGVDVWSAPADGSGRPQRFLADAASPSTPALRIVFVFTREQRVLPTVG